MVIYICSYELFLGKQEERSLWQIRDGEDSKKLREESDGLSSPPDEVFADALNSPELAKLLVGSLRNIEAQVKDVFKVIKDTKTSQIKVTESLDLSKKIDELETEIKNKDEKI